MITEKDVILAQTDSNFRESFISRNNSFILYCASKAVGHYVDTHDDLYSEALIAFNISIDSFSSAKGEFCHFSESVIRNRLRDYLRKNKKLSLVLPFSSLSRNNENGNENDFDVEDPFPYDHTISFEIEYLQKELGLYSVSFAELPSFSPKTQKARNACRNAVSHIISNTKLTKIFYEKRKLPSSELIREININRKTLERYRKYIVAGVIIASGKYPLLDEYFWGE